MRGRRVDVLIMVVLGGAIGLGVMQETTGFAACASCSKICHQYIQYGSSWMGKICRRYVSFEARDVFQCKNGNCMGGTRDVNPPYTYDIKQYPATCDLLCADCTDLWQEAANVTGSATLLFEEQIQYKCRQGGD